MDEEQQKATENLMTSGQVSQSSQMEQQAAQQQYFQEQLTQGIAESQLEVNQILEEAYHMLKQDIYTENEGKFEWVPLSDEKERTLTNWGVDRIMQVLKSYINKNTLLSNFNEDQINRRMLKFMLAMNGLMLMKYEFLFRQPSFEECKVILKDRLEQQKKLKLFAREIAGHTTTNEQEKEIKKELFKEIEHKIEVELEKIKSEKRKQNLREYEILITQLEQMVESTHNRAYRGEERGSLRRHTSIHEVLGNRPQTQQEKGGFFGFGKK
tara:strand:+ start:28 stop:831 length:804 start_codon:yes stop_codon:yes gene_type:complete